MITFLALLCSAIVTFGFFGFIIPYSEYRKNRKGKQTISFKAFKSLYNISPSKWIVNEKKYAAYLSQEKEKVYGFDGFQYCEYMRNIKEKIYMKAFIDQLRYSHFVRSKKKQEAKKEYNRETERLVKMWQNDIDAYRENAQKEIDDLVSRIEN